SRQPERCVFSREWNRPILNNLVLAQQLDGGHGFHNVSLDPDDLELVRSDPGSAFQIHRKELVSDFVAVHAVGPITALLKVNQPARFSVPIAQTLAAQVEVLAHIGMKYQRKSYESGGDDVVGKVSLDEFVRTVLLDGNRCRRRFEDGGDVVVLARFRTDRDAVSIERLMEQVLDRGET